MKTKITNTYTENGTKCKIIATFQLADECRNGHEDFSITGDIYEQRGTRWCWVSGGCVHDAISKHVKELRKFIPLHLSDFEGVPMYAMENGAFHIEENKRDVVADHFRVNQLEAVKMCDTAKGDKELSKIIAAGKIEQLGLVEQWKSEALEAIAYLEEKTGETFNAKGISRGCKVEGAAAIMEAYDLSPEGIEARRAARVEAKKSKLLGDLAEDFGGRQNKLNREHIIDKALIEFGCSTDNVIIYEHTKQIVINWKFKDGYGTYATAWPETTDGYLQNYINGNPLFNDFSIIYMEAKGEGKPADIAA